MGSKIREMTKKDQDAVFAMMREFYASPAVNTNGSFEIFSNKRCKLFHFF